MDKSTKDKCLSMPDIKDIEKNESLEVNEVNDIINHSGLSDSQKMKVLSIVSKSKNFSGPLPHPKHLKEYEHILPGAADRIICMAEKQSEHRQIEERKLIESEIIIKNRGQLFGFLLALIVIVGGIILLLFDKNATGLVTKAGCGATLIGAFIYEKRNSD